jgi:GDP-D-mannose dehydratase
MMQFPNLGAQSQLDTSLNFEKITKKAVMNAMKKNEYKLEYEKDEITPAEQVIMESSEYKAQQKSKAKVEESLKDVKEKLRTYNLQPKTQNIITLADKR